jgi:hypothetical protein
MAARLMSALEGEADIPASRSNVFNAALRQFVDDGSNLHLLAADFCEMGGKSGAPQILPLLRQAGALSYQLPSF